MDVFLADTQLNDSRAYLRPGFAFGGSCLPKDLRALNYYCRHADVDLPVFRQVLESNTLQIEQVARRILSRHVRSIGLFGLSIKAGTDDLRESPLVRLAELLIGKGCDLKIYDPKINPNELVGANKEYVNEHMPHLSKVLVDKPADLVADTELLILGHKTDQSVAWTQELPESLEILDLVYLSGSVDKPNVVGLYW